MLKKIKIATALSFVTVLSACGTYDRDFGIDAGSFDKFNPGIWVDGNGCDHWIVDDGFEGYMSPRLADDGTPICRSGAVPYTVINFDRSLVGL